MAFDLSAVLKDVSGPDTSRDTISYLPYASLIPDPKNGYSMDGIEDLARNIELVGLQQPPRVKDLGAGHYGLISGHRRYAAIGQILQRDPGAFSNGVPCIIDRTDGSVALRELQLILGNADNRAKTPADLLRDVNGLADCLRRLEAEGYHFPGRHREWISKMIGLSKTQIGRLQAIGKHLAPSLLEHFNAGELGITAAYRLSQEPEQIQHDVYRTLGKDINDLTEKQLEERINRAKTPRQDPPAQLTRSSFDAEAYLKERQEEDDTFFEMLTQRAKEFLCELNSPPVNTRSEGIERLKLRFRHRGAWGGELPSYNGSPKGLELESLTIDTPIFRTWTEVYDMLCTIALNRAALGESWGEDEDDEDEPEEEPLPVVRWEGRSVTPPTRELLLLYGLTNAGPKYTPAVYWGGSVFRKPASILGRMAEGPELTGIAQQFTNWLRLPNPNAFDETFQVAPPVPAAVPGTDTAKTVPAWQTGEPSEAGPYVTWCSYRDFDPDYEVLWWDAGGYWTAFEGGSPAEDKVLAWSPAPSSHAAPAEPCNNLSKPCKEEDESDD